MTWFDTVVGKQNKSATPQNIINHVTGFESWINMNPYESSPTPRLNMFSKTSVGSPLAHHWCHRLPAPSLQRGSSAGPSKVRHGHGVRWPERRLPLRRMATPMGLGPFVQPNLFEIPKNKMNKSKKHMKFIPNFDLKQFLKLQCSAHGFTVCF